MGNCMSREFEYALRKDVRNNPIVREVDRERHLELWRSFGAGVFLVAVLLFSAWQHFELLRHGYQVEQMQRERAVEEETRRQLNLEIDTLKSPSRIEKVATERLHMKPPAADEVTVIQLVTPPASPSRSLVARQ